MGKHITITDNGWLASIKPDYTSAQIRRNLLGVAGEKAAKLGWDVRLSGQHWGH